MVTLIEESRNKIVFCFQNILKFWFNLVKFEKLLLLGSMTFFKEMNSFINHTKKKEQSKIKKRNKNSCNA